MVVEERAMCLKHRLPKADEVDKDLYLAFLAVGVQKTVVEKYDVSAVCWNMVNYEQSR